jgi:hypothetical protein
MFVLYVAFAITGVYHGTGQHIADIKPPTEVPVGLKVYTRSIDVPADGGPIQPPIIPS